MSKFEAALEKAKAEGHDLENDPPHALTDVRRHTCKKCGRALLGNGGNVYGSASEGPCPKST